MNNSQRYPFWKLTELELALDAQSQAGQQVQQADFRSQTYAAAPGVYWHRIGCCVSPIGSALRRAWELQQQAGGWEPVCSSGAYTVFRRPADDGDKPTLPDGAKGYCEYLAGVIRLLETLRTICFFVTLVPLVIGYALDRSAVTRLGAIPLIIALALTYLVKFITQGKDAAEKG